MFDGHIKKNPAEDLDAPQKGLYLPKFLNQTEIENLLLCRMFRRKRACATARFWN